MPTPTIAISKFLRGRMDAKMPYSHFEGSEEELLELVRRNFFEGKDGYRDGVILVPVPPGGFFSPVCVLFPGQKLVGEFKARREGEAPRKSIGVENGFKTKAVACSIVLYSRALLEADGEEMTGADYECVMIQARTREEEEPMDPETLMHNHFGSDGGTDTEMSAEEFEKALRKSFLYWREHALLAG